MERENRERILTRRTFLAKCKKGFYRDKKGKLAEFMVKNFLSNRKKVCIVGEEYFYET